VRQFSFNVSPAYSREIPEITEDLSPPGWIIVPAAAVAVMAFALVWFA
jgi:hypothetical protein